MDVDQEDAPPTVNYPRMGTGGLQYLGLPRDGLRDAYHLLLTMPLGRFFAVMAAGFLTINAAFALLYLVDPHGLRGVRPGSFADAFFFSVQTLGTLGYGVESPQSFYANLVVTAETFVGLFNLAVATGLLFARISRPDRPHHVLESAPVVTAHNGQPGH